MNSVCCCQATDQDQVQSFEHEDKTARYHDEASDGCVWGKMQFNKILVVLYKEL
jgi:hypothetical protein